MDGHLASVSVTCVPGCMSQSPRGAWGKLRMLDPHPQFNWIGLQPPPGGFNVESHLSVVLLHEQMELVWAEKAFPCFQVLHLV